MNFLEPSGPLQACNGTDLLVYYFETWELIILLLNGSTNWALKNNDRDSGFFSNLGLSFSALLFRNVYLTTRLAMFCLIPVVVYCVSRECSKSALSRHAYSTTSLTGLLCTAVYVVIIGRGDVLLINNTTRPSTLPALTESLEAVLSRSFACRFVKVVTFADRRLKCTRLLQICLLKISSRRLWEGSY